MGCQECARDEGEQTAVVTGGGLSTGDLIKHKYINNRSHCYNYRKGGDRSCGVGLELEIPVRPQFSYTHTRHWSSEHPSLQPCTYENSCHTDFDFQLPFSTKKNQGSLEKCLTDSKAGARKARFESGTSCAKMQGST